MTESTCGFFRELTGQDKLVIPEGAGITGESDNLLEDRRLVDGEHWLAERRERYNEWLAEEIDRFNDEYDQSPVEAGGYDMEMDMDDTAVDQPPQQVEQPKEPVRGVLRISSRTDD